MPAGTSVAASAHSVSPLVMLQPQKERANVELHVINVGAGYSVPTGSNRRAIYLQTRVVEGRGKVLAVRECMFAPWYGPRPDDRSFLKEDEKRRSSRGTTPGRFAP